jgi:inosine/xanthosine triphosphate pyrophosphatase family protein
MVGRLHVKLTGTYVYPVPEIQGTTEEVSTAKCRRAAELVRWVICIHYYTKRSSTQVNAPCLVDDTALCFKALGGLPGPYIKSFMEKIGHDGELFSTDEVSADLYSRYKQIVERI